MSHDDEPGDHEGWTGLLSEHLDGTLPVDLEARLRRHLDGCPACSKALEELREVVARAQALEDRAPPRDLWPTLRLAIFQQGGRLPAGPTLAVAHGGPGLFLRRHRFSLSLAQLATAALVVTLLAGSAAWALRPLAAGADPAAAAGAAGGPGFASAVEGAPERAGSTAELDLLERALVQGRDQLSPHTVRILEKNLEVIDRAIRESAEALLVDPENPYLEEHLRRAQERRIEYLREATALLEAAD